MAKTGSQQANLLACCRLNASQSVAKPSGMVENKQYLVVSDVGLPRQIRYSRIKP